MPASDMPVARAISRMEAPWYPLSQKTSVAWSRIVPSWGLESSLLARDRGVGRRADCRSRAAEGIASSNVRSNSKTRPDAKQDAATAGSIPNIGQQALDFALQIGGEREQGQSRRPSVVAVEIHGVLQPGYTQAADQALCRLQDSI